MLRGLPSGCAVTVVDDIVEQLKRDRLRRPLKDPFPRAYPGIAPEDYVADVVRQRIDSLVCLRDRTKHKIQPDVLSDVRRQYRILGILLRRIRDREVWLRKMGAHSAFNHVTPEALGELIDWIQIPDDAWQEPPPGRDILGFYCADEMFDLIEWFAPRRPSSSVDGPFRLGTTALYRFVTGARRADMKRICGWVLNQRRKVRQHN
jgi:hypothetical protein